jgi:hypothetical protein
VVAAAYYNRSEAYDDARKYDSRQIQAEWEPSVGDLVDVLGRTEDRIVLVGLHFGDANPGRQFKGVSTWLGRAYP